MNLSLTACRTRGAVLGIALAALVLCPVTAHADYLVQRFAHNAPLEAHGPLNAEPLGPPMQPLTVFRRHEDTEGLDGTPDEATIAAALQALLVCAIPPPVNTVITNTPPETPPPPGVPLPPPFTAPIFPEAAGTSGSVTTQDTPEPASLVTALVGVSMAGMLVWRRQKRKKRRLAA